LLIDRTRLVLRGDVEGVERFQTNAPIVLRVHVHDSLAADCPADYRERCERAVVVEKVLWTAEPTPDELGVHVDGMATVTADALTVWSEPSARRSNRLSPELPGGAVVFVVEGAEDSRGVDWWLIAPEYVEGKSLPFGWVNAVDADGGPTLDPFLPACPPIDEPIAGRTIGELGSLRALACFGQQELKLSGEVDCTRPIIEWAIGGASWIGSNRWCVIDDAMELFGPGVTGLLDQVPSAPTVGGRYEVQGHFEDPEAERCGPVRFGTPGPPGTPTPQTVLHCRQMFVVTSVTELP
jgi:hypothetical protein